MRGGAVQAVFTLFLREERRPPLDCVGGTLSLHGSTAFAPAVRAAAEDYLKRCEGAGVSIPLADNTFKGSTDGVTDLDQAGKNARIQVGDGLADHIALHRRARLRRPPPAGPQARRLPVFTLVVNKDAGVENLRLAQIRDLFAGVTNWSQVGGNDVPVHLVNRDPGSGTRSTLVAKVLDGREPPQFTVTDCAALKPASTAAAQVTSTDTMLNTQRLDARRHRLQRGHGSRRPQGRRPARQAEDRRQATHGGGRRGHQLPLLADRVRLHLRRGARPAPSRRPS